MGYEVMPAVQFPGAVPKWSTGIVWSVWRSISSKFDFFFMETWDLVHGMETGGLDYALQTGQEIEMTAGGRNLWIPVIAGSAVHLCKWQ